MELGTARIISQIVKQLKITREEILSLDMSSTQRICLDQWHRGVRDIERGLSIEGNSELAEYFSHLLNSQ
jgi:hypothetical protein